VPKQTCVEYNRGADFNRNFIGVDVNPDGLVATVRGGASYEEMHHCVEDRRTPPVKRPPVGSLKINQRT